MTECIITSSVLIAVVAALRLLFRGKVSHRLQYALWGFVLLRLLMPFPLTGSSFSVMNWVKPGDSSVVSSISSRSITLPTTQLAASGAQSAETESATAGQETPETVSAPKTSVTVAEGLAIVWIAGGALALAWVVGTNLEFYCQLKDTRKLHEISGCELPVYVTDAIASPCLFGIFRPSLYLTPKAVENEKNMRYVLSHELCHYRHGDHIWSLLRGICLAVYWWNPLVWVAAILSRADSELACDEAVLRQIGGENRLAYGHTLVDMIAVKQPSSGIFCAATMMVSGKRGIQERLNMIIKNQKTLFPALTAVVLAVALCAGCTFTGAKNTTGETSQTTEAAAVSDYAQTLYNNHNAYIGDNSADSALLQIMGISKLGAYTIELETSQEPYILQILFSDPVSDADTLNTSMEENAMLLLALIDNASEIQWQYTCSDQTAGGEGTFTGSMTKDAATAALNGTDIKSYGQSAEKVQALLDWLNAVASSLTPSVSQDVSSDTTESTDALLEDTVSKAILSENAGQYLEGDFATESHTTLKTVTEGNTTTVYTIVLYLEFNYTDEGMEVVSGCDMPVALTFTKTEDGGYDLTEYWEPTDGTEYTTSIQEKFPSDICEIAMNLNLYTLSQEQACYAAAIKNGSVDTDKMISHLLDTIASSPASSSDPADYISAHDGEYLELMYCGNYTLRYAYTQFLKGGQTDLKGALMAAAVQQLLGSEAPSISGSTAQDWFDQWKAQAENILSENTADYMKANYPKTAMMLEMAGENV